MSASDLVFLVTSIECMPSPPGLEESFPVFTLFGNLRDGTPVRVSVADFVPYFFAEPSVPVDPSAAAEALGNSLTRGRCLAGELVERRSVYGYAENTQMFVRFSFNTPLCFRQARELLETGLSLDGLRVRFRTFESTLPPVLRFMNDLGLNGMSYVRVSSFHRISYREYTASSKALEPIPPEGDYLRIPPLKLLSFDIECCGETSAFPDPHRDPVIQIGNTVQRFGSDPHRQIIFCLKETAPIPNAEVRSFDSEYELISAWRDFLLEEDPDVLTGYNITGFDIPYLLERAETLKVRNFVNISRSDRCMRVTNRAQSSSAFGAFDAKDVSIDGGVVLDVLHVVRREHKLRSYSLNAVSLNFLGEQKEDVPYTSISSLQHGNAETRRRIASYCLRDTLLPLRLLDKLNILVNYTELSRVTGVPLTYFLSRGAAIKVLSQIYRAASAEKYLVPDMDGATDAGYEGAFVMEPLRGFYDAPIAVLDFSSLYPSIMISKNLCYTTLLSRSQYEKIGGIRTPTGNYFCSTETREGLVPRILRNLLDARRETRSQLAKVTDPWIKRSLDARQLALKVCANSIYGFTGAPAGRLPCFEISQSTTAFGREMIGTTKKIIEAHFKTENGYWFDAQVVYGDTDSVMVHLVVPNQEKKVSLSRARDARPLAPPMKMSPKRNSSEGCASSSREIESSMSEKSDGNDGKTGDNDLVDDESCNLPLRSKKDRKEHSHSTKVTVTRDDIREESDPSSTSASDHNENEGGYCTDTSRSEMSASNGNDASETAGEASMRIDHEGQKTTTVPDSCGTGQVKVDISAYDLKDPEKYLERVFETAHEIASFVTQRFEKPVSLAFEKVYFPFLLMNKKRYAGLVYSAPNRRGHIDTKGIETVRRDNCELVKNLVQACLDQMLLARDVEGAVNKVKETVRDLYLDRIDMSQLVISKTYTKSEYAAKQTHSELVSRLRQRGQEVSIGERIPYVIIEGDRKALTHEKSEDPLFVIENGLAIDKEYYIQQQLYKPIQRIFEPILDNVSSLFRGSHARQAAERQGVHGPLGTFVKACEACVGCGRPGSLICSLCKEDLPLHYMRLLKDYNEKTKRFNECWAECQRCQGSVLNEVLCVNRICPIWYMRMKIKKEIQPLGEKLQHLRDMSW